MVILHKVGANLLLSIEANNQRGNWSGLETKTKVDTLANPIKRFRQSYEPIKTRKSKILVSDVK